MRFISRRQKNIIKRRSRACPRATYYSNAYRVTTPSYPSASPVLLTLKNASRAAVHRGGQRPATVRTSAYNAHGVSSGEEGRS